MSTTKSDLRKVAPATLLQSLYVMGDFLEIMREFQKNSFHYKKHL